MNLIENIKGKKKNHRLRLSTLIEESDKIILCSGWMNHNGLKLLLPALEKAISNNAEITIYTNQDHTDDKSIKSLANIPSIRHIVVDKDENRYLHSKIYYFQSNNGFLAIIGSGNITLGGLVKNEELSIEISGEFDSPEYVRINKYLKHLESYL